MSRLSEVARSATNRHRPGPKPSIAILATPRSGSTWLAELIRSQPGFKSCDEPFNLRNPAVRRHLGVSEWDELYRPGADRRIESYLGAFLDGRLGFMNHSPLRSHHRWRTDRIVFRLLHCCEDRIQLLDDLGLETIHLVRHPLAVAASRQGWPRLEVHLRSSYLSDQSAETRRRAAEIASDGSRLEQAVLAWCLHNGPVLDGPPASLLISYEELTIDPEPVVRHLAGKLDLPHPDRMLGLLARPSASSSKSSERRRALLDRSDGQTADLITDWLGRVEPGSAAAAMDVCRLFGIDLYRGLDPLPTAGYRVSTKDMDTS